MQVLIDFTKSMFAMKMRWIVWVSVLLFLNLAGGLYFIDTPEGFWAAVTMMLNAALLVLVFKFYGFTRVMGLAHVPWIPLMIWLIWRVCAMPEEGGFRVWVLLVIVFNGASLALDTMDVVRYLRGEREPTVTLT